jgi:hypothetical protein
MDSHPAGCFADDGWHTLWSAREKRLLQTFEPSARAVTASLVDGNEYP